MAFLAGMFGEAAGAGVATAVSAVGNVIDNLFTSDDERLGREEAKIRLMQQPHLAQVELNKVEAQHRSLWVAGARPFILWVCGAALAYNFIIRDLLAWTIMNSWVEATMPPALQMEQLITVLLGMLGLGGLRTVEKLRGRAK